MYFAAVTFYLLFVLFFIYFLELRNDLKTMIARLT